MSKYPNYGVTVAVLRNEQTGEIKLRVNLLLADADRPDAEPIQHTLEADEAVALGLALQAAGKLLLDSQT